MRQRMTDTSGAKLGGNDKHAHDRPLWPKKLRFGRVPADIRDSTNDLTFNFSNDNFANIRERGNVSDFFSKFRPVRIRAAELLKGSQRQSVDLR